MDETRDRQLAAILARGLMRAQQQAEPVPPAPGSGNDFQDPTAAELPGDVHQPATRAADDDQGEQK